jgi:phosphopantothenoylcysteine synthetase/decarboxylase
MGTTRGYLDDVRYLSNYSSGSLGSRIAEELYRLGFAPHVVAGPSEERPRVAASVTSILTNDEMAEACRKIMRAGAEAAVLAASVLDFAPKTKAAGKIASADHEKLTVELARTKKIIADITPASGVKVGFKLETGLTPAKAKALADDYIAKYGLSLMVINDLKDVDRTRHGATVFEAGQAPEAVDSKLGLARRVAAHVSRGLAAGPTLTA